MKKKNRKNKGLLIVALILFITVGYAALATTLNITGNSEIKNAKWDIHFANLVVDSNSVEATTPAAIDADKTTINYGVHLVKPGDIYSFTVDVVNEGTIDGMISVVSNAGLTEEQQKYVAYSITYDNGSQLQEKDGLKAGTKRNVKVIVKYKDDINPEDLPSEEKTIDLIFKVTYVQADDTVTKEAQPLMNSDTSGNYHSNTYKSKVTKIVTKTDIDVPETAVEQWDVSKAGNGSVVAYVEDDGSGNGTYKVTIGGDGGKIIANENLSAFFASFTNLKEIDLSNLDTSNVTNMYAMFGSSSSLKSIDLSKLDLHNVTDMSNMLSGCSSLTDVNLSNCDLSNVTNMSAMFSVCSSLTNVNLTNCVTRNVTNMSVMFVNCSSLASLNLSSFNTSNVVVMASMFAGCTNLSNLNLSSFDTSKVANMDSIFGSCSKLTTTITISNPAMSGSMFTYAATADGAQITVNYTSTTSDLVDSLIASASPNCHIVKGSLVS